ncbi:AsmA-like C-terminal region-containing protein [Hymenobacter latericus]|uniref:AsmA-like C-terminal region-containing protein n=1 Tax=Hymenobacter sp. YIM 151858-1 TaxID=2987688 RepID=UPI002227E1C2|nr:AsmA-like C-terminal region-containing protein [Hymenobacter sp. YIM 151858-1]UYZ59724.1 AsmA-like C-terminal region-containing protein [Hymenobacter sp. YIM 151858-1]
MLLKNFRRAALLALLLAAVGSGLVLALLGTRSGRQQLEQQLREQLRQSTSLVASPYTVRLSTWQDFPHFTATVQGFALTDTAHGRPRQVLRVGRADLRLHVLALLRGRVQVRRLHLADVVLSSYVDSAGRRWGVHGRDSVAQPADPLPFELKSLRLSNVRLQFRNDYKHSAFAAVIQQAQLKARQADGLLQVQGQLAGTLELLRGRRGTMVARQPMRAWVHYRYHHASRQGSLRQSGVTLHGDTLHVAATHTTGLAGNHLQLSIKGKQPLSRVLPPMLPPSLAAYVADARSPSKAYIEYRLRGATGPTVWPRSTTRLQLRNAQLNWPDSARRIRRWNLLAVLDNGPAHHPRTTTLRLEHCRIFSSVGELDVQLTMRDFRRPYLVGRMRGRTDLPALAALVAPGFWQAHRGSAELDIALRGLLPPPPGQISPRHAAENLQARGTVVLRNAAFRLPDRNAEVRNLRVHLGMQDSVWQLNNLAGEVDGMRFQASATATHLLDYFTGLAPATHIRGRFAVEELRTARLRRLLQPAAPRAAGVRPNPRPRHAPADTSLIPPGLRLNIDLSCQRLLLPADTVYRLAAAVQHDSRRTSLRNLSARVWGGEVRGQASWPSAEATNQAPANLQLDVRFGALSYQRMVHLLTAKPRRRPAAPASALSEMLLAANGQANCRIATLHLPASGQVQNLRLRVLKTGNTLRMPYMLFSASGGGAGRATATARLAGGKLAAANANLDLRYRTLDIQRLLLQLASLAPDKTADDAPAATASAKPNGNGTSRMLTDGRLSARLRVRAEQVRYGVLTGSNFRALSTLQPGSARLEDCALHAFGGYFRLRGRLQTTAVQGLHPLHAQLDLGNVALPQLFRLADALQFDVLGSQNIRGTLHCNADVRTTLDANFLPAAGRTVGYASADVLNLELLNVAALEQAFKLAGARRTSHLVFEPVSSRFFFDRGTVLIPSLHLNSNLTDLDVSGFYNLSGQANLYLGLSPFQALLGNNAKRVGRILRDEPARRPGRNLTYVNLRRAPRGRNNLRLFKGQEKRQQQTLLQQQCRRLLLAHPLDTTLRQLQ